MKKPLMSLLIALMTVSLFGQWHDDYQIFEQRSYSSNSGGWALAVDLDTVSIVGEHRWSPQSEYRMCCRFKFGEPPTTPVKGTGPDHNNRSGHHPVLATTGYTLHMAWEYTKSFTEFDGNSWLQPYIPWGPSPRVEPAIADDAAGNTHLVYGGGGDNVGAYPVRYMRRDVGASSFTPEIELHSSGYLPSIAVSPNNQINVSFVSADGDLYYAYSTDGGSTWDVGPIAGIDDLPTGERTSICVDRDFVIYIAYVGSDRDVYVIANSGTGWGTPVNVSNSPGNAKDPSICASTVGSLIENVWVAWADSRGQTWEIYYNRLDGDTGLWDGDSALTSDDGRSSASPSVAADHNGDIHISWDDYRVDSRRRIFYNWRTGISPTRDIACVRIVEPIGTVDKEPIIPRAVVKNLGQDVDSCYAKCQIIGPGPAYDEGNEEGVIELYPDDEFEVEFPAWTPTGNPGDRYKVIVTAYLWPEKNTEDDDPANNTKTEYCVIGGYDEVDPILIIVPEENSTVHTMKPLAWFKNVGDHPAVDFYCVCEIPSVGGLTEYYADSVRVPDNEPLDPADSILIEFAEWTCLDDGPFEATFYAVTANEIGLESIYWTVDFIGSSVGVAEKPDALRIEVCGPNPFVDGTLISYALPAPTDVTIRVYDVSGQLVRTLHDGTLANAGSLYWDGRDDAGLELSDGLYFIRMSTPEFTRTAKLVMIK